MGQEPWEAGMHCWLDLMTTDLEGAKRFYTELLGWSLEALPMPDGSGGVYTMALLEGGPVGGMGQIDDKQREMGVPPHWMIYTAVESVDETAAKASDAGGGVMVAPFDIPMTGRMAILHGPGREVFALWERSSTHLGAARNYGQPGAFTWGELGTKNVGESIDFYTKVFDWKAETQPMGEGEYTVFSTDDGQAAGMYLMPPEMERVPPHWLAYFAVEDLDASTARALKLGAKQVCPATEAEGVGRFSILSDPQGASFALLQLARKE
jgi:uncharacterized protein